ncbi:hypothetical protein GJ744_011969 [Endocarpon pusillum]|uniref:Uncharacterized protein n=1 Tax=Endocarpon pusillum TaxID=364733 RepID=A0A8H7ATH3_9EURO|nr:hypothetical protein GJ744_011969 [Endocarpon pusillum]
MARRKSKVLSYDKVTLNPPLSAGLVKSQLELRKKIPLLEPIGGGFAVPWGCDHLHVVSGVDALEQFIARLHVEWAEPDDMLRCLPPPSARALRRVAWHSASCKESIQTNLFCADLVYEQARGLAHFGVGCSSDRKTDAKMVLRKNDFSEVSKVLNVTIYKKRPINPTL